MSFSSDDPSMVLAVAQSRKRNKQRALARALLAGNQGERVEGADYPELASKLEPGQRLVAVCDHRVYLVTNENFGDLLDQNVVFFAVTVDGIAE